MTAIELNAYKMELLSEIINGFNTEKALRKLQEACRFIKSEECSTESDTMPAALLDDLMTVSLAQDNAGLSITYDELKIQMTEW